MKISQDTVVTVSLRAFDTQGRLIADGKTPQAYLHGGYGNILPGIEKALEGQEPGFQADLGLAPAEAFGDRDEGLVTQIPKSQFPPGVKVGGHLRGTDDQGREQMFRVVKIKGPVVLLDGNHELAGQTLRVTVRVHEVRAATPEEVTHRHAHGAHGHHHH